MLHVNEINAYRVKEYDNFLGFSMFATSDK